MNTYINIFLGLCIEYEMVHGGRLDDSQYMPLKVIFKEEMFLDLWSKVPGEVILLFEVTMQ